MAEGIKYLHWPLYERLEKNKKDRAAFVLRFYIFCFYIWMCVPTFWMCPVLQIRARNCGTAKELFITSLGRAKEKKMKHVKYISKWFRHLEHRVAYTKRKFAVAVPMLFQRAHAKLARVKPRRRLAARSVRHACQCNHIFLACYRLISISATLYMRAKRLVNFDTLHARSPCALSAFVMRCFAKGVEAYTSSTCFATWRGYVLKKRKKAE